MIESFTSLIEPARTALHLFGLPALFVVFVLKGALVGKVFPTSVFLPGYVIATGASLTEAAIVIVVVTAAHVIGQTAIFVGSRRYGSDILDVIPGSSGRVTDRPLGRMHAWFDQYGDTAIFGSNLLPWSRGFIAIPAGTSAYPTARFMVLMTTATVLYHAAYVGVGLLGGYALV